MSCPVWGLSNCTPGDVMAKRGWAKDILGPQEQLRGRGRWRPYRKGEPGDGREQSPLFRGEHQPGARQGRTIIPLCTHRATACGPELRREVGPRCLSGEGTGRLGDLTLFRHQGGAIVTTHVAPPCSGSVCASLAASRTSCADSVPSTKDWLGSPSPAQGPAARRGHRRPPGTHRRHLPASQQVRRPCLPCCPSAVTTWAAASLSAGSCLLSCHLPQAVPPPLVPCCSS